MRVKCINNDGVEGELTVGKAYDAGVGNFSDNEFSVSQNDSGLENVNYYKSRFVEVVDEAHPTKLPTHNKYSREIKPSVFVDVYDVLRAFNVTDPCLQHLVKKALAVGQRGHKDATTDYEDILASSKRALEMHLAWK